MAAPVAHPNILLKTAGIGEPMPTDDEQRTVELSLSADQQDRLAALPDAERESILATAIDRELRIQEAIAALEDRQAGAGEDADAIPPPGPLDSPVGALLGLEVVSVGNGEAVLSMAAGRRHANRGGPVQGGVITALADTATAFAFMTTLDDDASTTNLELKINFLRPVFEAELEATATVVERGRTIGLVECDVRTPEEKLVARMSTTYMVLRGERAAGR